MNMLEEPIKDLNRYNDRMRQSMEDKMFFMDYAKTDYYLDIGCADGSLGVEIMRRNPNAKYFGLDDNDEMRELAKKKLPDAVISDSLEYLLKQLPDNANAVVIFSSVLHEIIGASITKDFLEFAKMLRQYKHKLAFISVRDMYNGTRPEDRTHLKEVADKILASNAYTPEQFLSFNKAYGPMDRSLMNCYHFLLKYRYKENWDREILENYFSLNVRTFLRAIMAPDYFAAGLSAGFEKTISREGYHEYRNSYAYDPTYILHLERYILPYIKSCVKRDFNIDLKYPTHIKLVVRYR